MDTGRAGDAPLHKKKAIDLGYTAVSSKAQGQSGALIDHDRISIQEIESGKCTVVSESSLYFFLNSRRPMDGNCGNMLLTSGPGWLARWYVFPRMILGPSS